MKEKFPVRVVLTGGILTGETEAYAYVVIAGKRADLRKCAGSDGKIKLDWFEAENGDPLVPIGVAKGLRPTIEVDLPGLDLISILKKRITAVVFGIAPKGDLSKGVAVVIRWK